MAGYVVGSRCFANRYVSSSFNLLDKLMKENLGVKMPVRVSYAWHKARFGHCDYCGEWAALVDQCCADCYDAAYQEAREQAYTTRIKELIVVIKGALEQLPTCQKRHYVCEDSYYSCPVSGDSLSDSSECDCGADRHNGRLSAIMSSFEGVLTCDQ